MNVLLRWRRLAEIFSFIKIISHVNFISLVLEILVFSVYMATKLTFSKIYHLISLGFGRSEHEKSQCEPVEAVDVAEAHDVNESAKVSKA